MVHVIVLLVCIQILLFSTQEPGADIPWIHLSPSKQSMVSLCHIWGLPQKQKSASATAFLFILCPNIMEANKNQSCTWSCFENGVNSQHPYWETRRTCFCLYLFLLLLVKQGVLASWHVQGCRKEKNRIGSVAIMYVCMCMCLVNFRKCFWGQDIRRSNN